MKHFLLSLFYGFKNIVSQLTFVIHVAEILHKLGIFCSLLGITGIKLHIGGIQCYVFFVCTQAADDPVRKFGVGIICPVISDYRNHMSAVSGIISFIVYDLKRGRIILQNG